MLFKFIDGLLTALLIGAVIATFTVFSSYVYLKPSLPEINLVD